MRIFVLILLFATSVSLFAHPNLIELRDLFAKAAVDEDANNELYKATKSYSLKTFPVYYAYNAAAEMTLANHAVWPTTKLSYFNAGKVRLEEAVQYQPENVEIRYIRYCVQQGCPFFLGYTANLTEDKKFILANLDKTNWTSTFKEEVKKFLN